MAIIVGGRNKCSEGDGGVSIPIFVTSESIPIREGHSVGDGSGGMQSRSDLGQVDVKTAIKSHGAV